MSSKWFDTETKVNKFNALVHNESVSNKLKLKLFKTNLISVFLIQGVLQTPLFTQNHKKLNLRSIRSNTFFLINIRYWRIWKVSPKRKPDFNSMTYLFNGTYTFNIIWKSSIHILSNAKVHSISWQGQGTRLHVGRWNKG